MNLRAWAVSSFFIGALCPLKMLRRKCAFMFLRRPMTRHVILRKTASNNSHVIRQQPHVTAGSVCGFFFIQRNTVICLIVLLCFIFPHYFSFLTSKKILEFFFFCIKSVNAWLLIISYSLASAWRTLWFLFSYTFAHV